MSETSWNIINVLTICSCLTFLALAVGAGIYFVQRKRSTGAASSASMPVRAASPSIPASIQCASCRAVNPPENNFCEQCGASLAK